MKRHILRGALFALMSTSLATAYTNKTFLLPRSTSVNLPMEYTGFKRLTQEDNGPFGAYLQTSVFYSQSANAAEIAKYFLVNDKSTITFPLSANVTVPGPVVIQTRSTVTNDVDLGYLENFSIDAVNATAFDTAGGTPTLTLAPKQEAYGFVLAYHQKLGNTGWLLDLSLPIVNIENDLEFKFTGQRVEVPAFVGQPFDLKQNLVENFTGVPLTMVSGGLDARFNTFHTAAKFGKTRSAGAADLDVRLAYQVLNKVNYHGTLGAGLTVPMGNRPTGEFVFEAIRGNGRHFGLGADLDFDARIWGNVEHNLIFNIISHYRYLFTTKQTRTLGLKGRPFGQHYLLGHNGDLLGTLLTPAANVLTLPVDVAGRSQCDTVFGFTYNNCALTADLGYNLYYRDAEVVRQRTVFQDGMWAVAARGFNPRVNNFNINDPDAVDGGVPGTPVGQGTAVVNNSTIDADVAATPSQCTHSVYASIGYLLGRDSDYPWMLSVGGKYEWPERNSALEQWGIWGKAGVGF